MNIIFSDKCVSDFSNLGDVASRITLNTGKAAKDRLHWVGVQCAIPAEENNSNF
jgi:hypothetical protein